METSRARFNPRRTFGQSAQSKVYRLHPAEKALAWVTALILIFQPWALGGMRLWSQWIVGGLALLAFIIALLPRHYTDEHQAGPSFRFKTWPKLLRFPIFWLGLIYFAIILIQIANPAWRYVSSPEKSWWIARMDYITWLPHGFADQPVSRMMNGWRTILIQGAAWLTVCALWIGVTRRKTARILLTTIALNGVGISIVILIQRLIGAEKILWLIDPGKAHYFAGSFRYKNHAGEFLILILALCLGLAWWHRAHAARLLQKSHPGAIFVIFVIVALFALFLTYARAASALGATLCLIVGLSFAIHSLFKRSHGPPRIVSACMTLLGAAFLYLCLASFNTDRVWGKFARVFQEDKVRSIEFRQVATKATLEAAKDSLITGHGAGSFRFIFPLYQQHHPEIWKDRRWDERNQKYHYGRIFYWEHAHNDYAEFLAEMGLIGAALAFTGVIILIGAVRQSGLLSNPPLIIMMAGPGLVAVSAYVDFPMHNPAILVASVSILVLTLRWAQLTHK